MARMWWMMLASPTPEFMTTCQAISWRFPSPGIAGTPRTRSANYFGVIQQLPGETHHHSEDSDQCSEYKAVDVPSGG